MVFNLFPVANSWLMNAPNYSGESPPKCNTQYQVQDGLSLWVAEHDFECKYIQLSMHFSEIWDYLVPQGLSLRK